MPERVKPSRSIGPNEHACAFYRDTYHQLSITVPYLRAAILRHERCVYLLDDLAAADVIDAMAGIGFDLYPVIKREQLTFHAIWETHFRGGDFDPRDPIAFYTERLKETKAHGYQGLAIVGAIASSLRPSVRPALIEYERTAAQHFAGMPISAICLYHEDRCSPSFLTEIRAAHPVEAANHCPYFLDGVRECTVDRDHETPEDVQRTIVTFCSNANFDCCPIYQRMPHLPVEPHGPREIARRFPGLSPGQASHVTGQARGSTDPTPVGRHPDPPPSPGQPVPSGVEGGRGSGCRCVEEATPGASALQTRG